MSIGFKEKKRRLEIAIDLSHIFDLVSCVHTHLISCRLIGGLLSVLRFLICCPLIRDLLCGVSANFFVVGPPARWCRAFSGVLSFVGYSLFIVFFLMCCIWSAVCCSWSIFRVLGSFVVLFGSNYAFGRSTGPLLVPGSQTKQCCLLRLLVHVVFGTCGAVQNKSR